jgi:hypothetical protein
MSNYEATDYTYKNILRLDHVFYEQNNIKALGVMKIINETDKHLIMKNA